MVRVYGEGVEDGRAGCRIITERSLGASADA